MNDTIYAYSSFAQNSGPGDDTLLLGHPIASFLWNSQANGQTQIQYYGHLSEPTATDPNFVGFVALVERQGILPVLSVSGPNDLDLTNADNARLLHWLESWQANGFQPAWSTDWTGSLIQYQGVSGAAATLRDSGSVISLNAGGSTLYQRVHDSTQQETTGYIANWPAFDATRLYGLDPAEQYWLDAVPRPATTHITDLPSGVQVGAVQSSNLTDRKRLGIMARYARGSTAQLGSDWEGLCVIRIISKRTGKSMRLAVW